MNTVVTKGERRGKVLTLVAKMTLAFLIGLSMRNFVANSYELCLAHFIG